MLLAAGCGRPRTIPGDELTAIFREAFLVNAYYDTHGYRADSADIYGPIIARHGYKVRDFDYTVTNFARKKSAKLSDVVGKAIDELTAEAAAYDAQVAMRDTVDAIAARATSRRVWSADSIIVRKASDTARLRVRVPALKSGEYAVEYRYLIDTADKNMVLNTSLNLLDSNGVRRGVRMENIYTRGTSTRSGGLRIEPDSSSRWVELRLGSYPEKLSAPYARFDSVRVTHYLPRREALDSVSGRWLNISRYDYTQNSGAPRPLPPRLDSLAAH